MRATHQTGHAARAHRVDGGSLKAVHVTSRAAVVIVMLLAAACGRLGFEPQPITSGDGGSGGASGDGGVGGAGGSGGTSGNEADASDDASSLVDASSDSGSDAELGDASMSDAMNDAMNDAASAVCGNGRVEAAEQCDDGAETATCDDDCSFAACGDDTLNVTAGEACDDSAAPTTCSASCEAISCRANCTCEWYRGARYMLCPELLDYPSARTACSGESMRLVRITATAEQTFLRWRTLQDGYGKFHLGATDATEGTWRWDDGRAFWQGVANGAPIDGEFSAWAQGEPNSFVAEENCSEVQSLRGWNDCVCDLAKQTVCKSYLAPADTCGNGVIEPGEACDDAAASATCDEDCSLASCGDGVLNRARGEVCDDAATGDYCSNDCSAFLCPAGCTCFDNAGRHFAMCAAPSTFRQASIACGRAGMMLAHVESAAVDQELRARADQASVTDVWIGAFDVDQANNWVWSDLSSLWIGTATGMALAYAHFTTGAPSGAMNLDCLSMLPSGEWQDADCDQTKAYVCESF